MTNIELHFATKKYDHSFFELNRDIDMSDKNDSENDCNNSFVLISRKERAALLKTGLTGKDIESLYLRFNNIAVIGINWQD
ncbi:MAG TPA: hypothetical protein VN368_03295 [Candidatus Methylomirabilis sp.]|nr:hypothetical protein [Candidatus Methylomirabilis sp.]